MTNNNKKYYTNGVYTKVGDRKVVTAMSVKVQNVAGEDGKIIFYKPSDDKEREANVGMAPTLNETPNGRKAARVRVVFENDTKNMNYGETNKVAEDADANGNVTTYVDVQAYGGAAEDLVRVAHVGGRIAIVNGIYETTVDENGRVYPKITVGGYGQIQSSKVSKRAEGEETPAPKATPTKTPAKKAEPVSEEIEDDPFADAGIWDE